ncbi:MAG: zinc-dependent metalloprotease [Sporichthyaceae bacterium]
MGGGAMVDWGLAKATAHRLMSSGPSITRSEAAKAVGDLRRYAEESAADVAGYTGLHAPPATPATVVDRRAWVEVNVDSFAEIFGPLLDKLAATRKAPGGALVGAVGSRVSGVELGGLLAFMGSKVLGQYEPFQPTVGGSGYGTLLLVAPNIVHAERELEVDPGDFRRWVCLHEETHRVQFTAVPWMRGHLSSELSEFLLATDLDPAAVLRRVTGAAQGLADLARGKGETSLVELFANAEQRAALDRITALMSLLEGHAEHVMDGVGPSVVPTVADIRTAFAARRASATGLDALLRRVLGLEAKMRQYRDGSLFVTAVVDKIGMAGFNQIWTSPETLPTVVELHDPLAWIARVHRPELGTSAKG